MVLSILVVLFIVNKEDNPAYKIAWIIPILLFPIFGGLLYLFLGNKKPTRRMRDKIEKEHEKHKCRVQNQEVIKDIEKQDLRVAGQVRYLSNHVGFPIYENTNATYYKSGEQKAQEGLDVRLIYDDMGCVSNLPYKYDRILEARGIKCMAFNPFIPFVSLAMNNRDHRKILVIDGHTGFTGGINLADEYINEYEKYGYWKDAGIMLKGDAVWNLTVMFLSMWDYIDNKEEDYIKFKPSKNKYYNSKGYVQPFDDSPLINEPIGETVYLNLINKAKDYIYINTPYLIIDNEMATALKIAAKSGVDIKIVTPYIPDKNME